MSNYGSPVTLLTFQMAPKLILLMSSGSKKKEPRYACLNEAKASHSQRMWTEVSSFTPHLLHSRLSSSPSRWRCLLRVLCPVWRPITALDWVMLKDRNLALAPRQGPEISSRACLWVSPRPRQRYGEVPIIRDSVYYQNRKKVVWPYILKITQPNKKKFSWCPGF